MMTTVAILEDLNIVSTYDFYKSNYIWFDTQNIKLW